MRDYHLWQKRGKGSTEIHDILKESVRENIGANEYIRRLKEKGLGYRRKEALEDYRRARVIEHARTDIGLQKAETWFDKIFEPFRKLLEYTFEKAMEIINRFRWEEAAVLEQDEDYAEWMERYEQVF